MEVASPPVLAPLGPESKRTAVHAAPLSSRLLNWRRQSRFGRLEALLFAIYCLALAAVIPFHEPWADEAQAWLLASNNSAWQIVRHALHYEGAPPLWHLLLHVLSLAHGSFTAVSWMGAVFAAAGAFVLLRWSPFPLIVRLLLPFTFFLQYQYAVVARSYTLFPLLVFSVCALYHRRHTVRFGIAAGLLANLSVQGMIIAVLICGIYAWDLYRDSEIGFFISPKQIVGGAVAFCALAGIATFAAIPAPDVNFAVSDQVSQGTLHKLLVRFCGETENFFPSPAAAGPIMPPPPVEAEPNLLRSPATWAAWELNYRDRDRNGYPLPQSRARSVAEFFVSIASQAAWPVARSNFLAGAFLCALFLWLRRKRSLRALLPWLAIMVFGQFIWVADHHVGMIFVAMIAAIWIAADRRPAPNTRLDNAFIGVFAVVLALQVVWSIVCVRRDIRGSYDPGRETALYMKAHPVASTAAFHYWSVAVQPYFDHNPFINIPARYWIWSYKANPDPYYQEVVDLHPDRIVDSVEFHTAGQMRDQWIPLNHIPSEEDVRTLPWDYALQFFHENGYVETHRFCGTRFQRLGTSFMDCNLILEPVKRNAP